jgi:hypothetical protein
MQKNQKGLTKIFWILIIIGLVGIFVATYFLFIKNNKFSLILNKNSNNSESYESLTDKRIAEARLKVSSETKVLENLVERAEMEKNKTTQLKNEYTSINSLLEKNSDNLFKNPKSINPQIKIDLKDNSVEKKINTSRRDVQKALDAWKSKLDEYNTATNQKSNTQIANITLAEILATSQKSVTIISEYINQLKSLISSLTTENSNLTKAQIDSYIKLINDTIKDLEKIKSEILADSLKKQDTDTKPVVTPIQIKNQEVIVEQVKTEQVKIEQELTNDDDGETSDNDDQANDTVLPAILITSPNSGTDLSYGVLISASASDNEGISKVEFYDGANLIGTDTTAPYSMIWGTTTVSDGAHSLTAKAYDNSLNIKTSVPVSVTISNSENPLDNINVFEDPELIEGANPIN